MSAADTIVVGLGSIGQRHARVLTALGRSVATVSRRGGGDHRDLGAALSNGSPDYVVIANETSAHRGSLGDLAASGYAGRVMVEKPLLNAPAAIPAAKFDGLFVGYNLRFHPALQYVHQKLSQAAALSAVAYVGQYLPDWRPGRDYRSTASATAEAGGGVLRDLSHELDFLLWLFGPWRRVTAIVLKTGTLEISSDDVATVLMECERCPAVAVCLNYHHRPLCRTLTVNTAQRTYMVDLARNIVTDNGNEQAFEVARDDTFIAMHRAILDRSSQTACTGDEGIAVVELIGAIERSARERSWVMR